MEALSVSSSRVSTLPSPTGTLKRKSPSSSSSASVENAQAKPSTDIIGTLTLAPKSTPNDSDSDIKETVKVETSDNVEDEDNSEIDDTPAAPLAGAHEPQQPSSDDLEKGLVVCTTCGEGIPFRDPQSGGFTLRLWDLHKDQCRLQRAPHPEPIIFTPETTADAMANPPHKKRRAKRTEEERIEYLRTDPYVAEFEPYRVLCKSCNKWIRLRPNSTYCSIPWDAHRKSCLSKKAHSKTAHSTATDANGLKLALEGDLDVRKFDVERVMCAHCDRWIPIGSDGSEEALQAWFKHKKACWAKTPPQQLSFRQVQPREMTRAAHTALPSVREVPDRGRDGHSTSPTSSAAGSTHIAPSRPPSHLSYTEHSQYHKHPSVSRAALHSSLHTTLSTVLTSVSTDTTRPPSTRTPTTLSPSVGGSPPVASSTLVPSASSSPASTAARLVSVAASTSVFAAVPVDKDKDNAQRASPTFKDLHPVNFAPSSVGGAGGWAVHESRRRNAEQRAAALRADPLLSVVEANRVFCSMCEKWVQLRQDSAFCAYPWQQHRSKCLVRYHRKQEKTNSLAHGRHRYGPYTQRAKYDTISAGTTNGHNYLGNDLDADGELEDQLDSEEEHVTGAEFESEEGSISSATRHGKNLNGTTYQNPSAKYRVAHIANTNGYVVNGSGTSTSGATITERSASYHLHSGVNSRGGMDPARQVDEEMEDLDMDAEGDSDLDGDGDTMMGERGRRVTYPKTNAHTSMHHSNNYRAHTRAHVPRSLADLDSEAGRVAFVAASVQYLFRTTYEQTDDMSIETLVNYLNAAMPMDKHEDFDTPEVTKTASRLAKAGTLILEGNIVRLP